MDENFGLRVEVLGQGFAVEWCLGCEACRGMAGQLREVESAR